MGEVVFLPIPAAELFFPRRKVSPYLFLKVKQIFLKIKSEAG
jgi:hypothetical protein